MATRRARRAFRAVQQHTPRTTIHPDAARNNERSASQTNRCMRRTPVSPACHPPGASTDPRQTRPCTRWPRHRSCAARLRWRRVRPRQAVQQPSRRLPQRPRLRPIPSKPGAFRSATADARLAVRPEAVDLMRCGWQPIQVVRWRSVPPGPLHPARGPRQVPALVLPTVRPRMVAPVHPFRRRDNPARIAQVPPSPGPFRRG